MVMVMLFVRYGVMVMVIGTRNYWSNGNGNIIGQF